MQGLKSHQVRTALLSGTGLGAMFLLLILVNVIFSYSSLRWDATEEKSYSLSEGSRNILAKIEQPVSIMFFWNRGDVDLPRDVKLYGSQVRDFLAEYEVASRGKVTVKEYVVKADSDEEETAARYGLQPIQSPSGTPLYCGLVLVAADHEEKIPFLDPGRESTLEYEVTRAIYQIQSPKKKSIGLCSSLPLSGMPAPGSPAVQWAFMSELSKVYDVKEIEADDARLPSGIDLLVLIHPKKLSLQLQFAIDQYVLAGGKVLVFVDPFCIAEKQANGFAAIPSSGLATLFNTWGIAFKPMSVVVDFGQAARLRIQQGAVEDNPLFIAAGAEAFNRGNNATANLETMLFGLSGTVAKAEDSPYEFETLIQSSENAAVIPSIRTNAPLASIRKDFKPSGTRFPLAAMVRGVFKTAFPDGRPPEESPAEEVPGLPSPPPKKSESSSEPALKQGTAKSSIIVVADVDLLSDPFFIETGAYQGVPVSRMFNDNFNFAANACAILMGSEDLIALRSRGRFLRPFTTVRALERVAQDRWLAKEQELAKQADETTRKLQELQVRKDQSQQQIFSPEQEAEIRGFRERKQRVDRELREVRKNLRVEIDALGTRLLLFNVVAVPLLVTLAGLGFALSRRRKARGR